MGDFPIETNSISPTLSFLWVLYPMAVVVGLELFLRAISNDDDDNEEWVTTPCNKRTQSIVHLRALSYTASTDYNSYFHKLAAEDNIASTIFERQDICLCLNLFS